MIIYVVRYIVSSLEKKKFGQIARDAEWGNSYEISFFDHWQFPL